MSNQTQIILRISLKITKVCLKVRFPCSISCSLKVEGREQQIEGEVDLKNGEALMNIQHTQNITLNLPRDAMFASQKKCALLIYLKSTSGRIPAGTIALPINRQEAITHRQISRIQKCPDKNALIQYEFYMERADNRGEYSSESIIQKVVYPYKNQYLYKEIDLKRNISPNLNRTNSQSLSKKISPGKSFQNQINTVSSNQILRYSQAQGSIAGKQTVPLRRMGSKKDYQGRSSILEDYYLTERQKASEQQKIFSLERQVEATKTKLSIVQGQLGVKTGRITELQKQIRQCGKKIQQMQLQVRSGVSKAEGLQRSNRQLMNQAQSLKERMQEEKLKYENMIKRIEIRETSSKDQLKSLTQKLYACENEKQRMLFQKNSLSNQFEGRQKKLREAFKEKEKKMLEEKSFSLKKIDGYQKQIQKLNEQITQFKVKNSESLNGMHQLRLLVQSLEADRQRSRAENNDLRFQLTKCRNQRKMFQDVQENNGKFNEERRNYRRQISEKQMENTQLKDRLTNVEANYLRSKSSLEQMDKQIKEKTNQLKISERDYNNLMRDHKILISDLADKQAKLAAVIQQMHMQGRRANQFEGKYESLEDAMQDIKDAQQREAMDYAQRIHSMQEQIQKLSQEIFTCNQSISVLEKENEELEHMVEQKEELIQNLQSNLIQINQANQQYQLQKLQLAEYNKQLESKYQKKLEQQQEEIKNLHDQLKEYNRDYEERLMNSESNCEKLQAHAKQLEKVIKEKEDQITKLSSKITKSQEQIQRLKESEEDKEQTITKFKKEIGILNDKMRELEREVDDKEVVNNSLRSQKEKIQYEISSLHIKTDILSAEIKRQHGQNIENQQKFDRFKLYALTALDFLASQIGVSQCNEQIEHIDEQFYEKCNNFLKKMISFNQEKKAQIKKLALTVQKLQTDLFIISQQKHNKQKNLLTAQKNLQDLKKSTVVFSEEITTKMSLVNKLRDELVKKQDEIQAIKSQNANKISALNNSNNIKNKQITELKQYINDLEVTQKEQKDINANNELKILQMEKQRKIIQSELKTKVGRLEASIRAEMQKVNGLQIEKGELQKQIQQQKQNVRKAFKQLQGKCYQIQQLRHKVQECLNIQQQRQLGFIKEKEVFLELKQLLEALINTKVQLTKDKLQSKLPGTKQFNLKSYTLPICLCHQNQSIFTRAKQYYSQYQLMVQTCRQKTLYAQQVLKQLETISYQVEQAKKGNQKNKNEYLKQTMENQQEWNKQKKAMLNENNQLVSHSKQLESQLALKEKQRIRYKRELEQLKFQMEEIRKNRDKEMDFKLEAIRFVDDQRGVLQAVKKTIDQMMRTTTNLQKERKVSMFSVMPLKELMKKSEELIVPHMKSAGVMYAKHKREWDLANIRAKKKQT